MQSPKNTNISVAGIADAAVLVAASTERRLAQTPLQSEI
jgi:hypothetical protein